jgi:hypothetical protein
MIRLYLVSGFFCILSPNDSITACWAVYLTVETNPHWIFDTLRYGHAPVMATRPSIEAARVRSSTRIVAITGAWP